MEVSTYKKTSQRSSFHELETFMKRVKIVVLRCKELWGARQETGGGRGRTFQEISCPAPDSWLSVSVPCSAPSSQGWTSDRDLPVWKYKVKVFNIVHSQISLNFRTRWSRGRVSILTFWLDYKFWINVFKIHYNVKIKMNFFMVLTVVLLCRFCCSVKASSSR